METIKSVDALIRTGNIPEDSEVVSTNNKIVIISRGSKLVARIGNTDNLKLRDDPHDLSYSHNVSWIAGDFAPIVKPIHKQIRIIGNFVISTYPLLNNEVVLDKSRAADIYCMVSDIGNSLEKVKMNMELRRLDVSAYVQERLDSMRNDTLYDQKLLEYLYSEFSRIKMKHPFDQLVRDDPALIHGDYKKDNIVADHNNKLHAIDLDAAAVGPRLYDLASWRLRCELGDAAPIEDVVNIGRQTDSWNEDVYKSLIGWKAISSMSFSLKYETPEISANKIMNISRSAVVLGGIETLPRDL